MMRKVIYLLSILVFFTCCKNDLFVQYKNQESDKRVGEKVMDIYFDNLLLDQRNDNLSLFSKEFFKENDKNKLSEQNRFIENKLGKVLGKELKHWETSVIKGTNPKSEYLFVYDVKREKYNSLETFYLMKEKTDSIKIYSFKIESEGLLTSE